MTTRKPRIPISYEGMNILMNFTLAVRKMNAKYGMESIITLN